MAQMLVDELILNKVPLTRGHYWLNLRMGAHHLTMPTDDNLGHLMTACSALWKSVAFLSGQTAQLGATARVTSPIRLSEIRIEKSLVVGERWTLRMTSGPYRYVAGMGGTLESVMLAFMGAMKFFSFKYGYTTLDPEVVRNRAQAVRDGMTTKEDHVKRAKPGRHGHR